jgi:hypothetical protein
VILLGLRLTVSGGRDTVNSQNDRHAWLDTTPATRDISSASSVTRLRPRRTA